MQVDYDLGYDRQYENADHFPDRTQFGSGQRHRLFTLDRQRLFDRRTNDRIRSGHRRGRRTEMVFQTMFSTSRRHGFRSGAYRVTENWPEVFGFRYVGEIRTGFPNRAQPSFRKVLQNGLSGRRRRRQNADSENYEKPLQIVAVYRDFPKNSSVKTMSTRFVRSKLPSPTSCIISWRTMPDTKAKIEADLTRKIRETDGDSTKRIRLHTLHDVYYATDCISDSTKKAVARPPCR